ncbi:MAG TPA: endonuclease/exonuclease/phosphatase family protein [Pyrinomonadaceae bacterium]|nr:endonuclease/exonuclease/phosphatase family protein [Pyrinomonadaceae bacterium]
MPPANHKETAKAGRAAPEVERGGIAPPAARAASPGRIVVATYNIRYAVGSRLISGGLLRKLGVARPGRRAALVGRNIEAAARVFTEGRALPPVDLLALQEADRATRRAGGRHVARELAERLGMFYARAASPTPRDVAPKDRQWWLDFEEPIGLGEEGDIGVALLSRRPPEEVGRVELPWSECPWRPRLALAATVELGGRPLRVFNAHIDPHAGVGEQLRQHEAILARAAEARGPVLLLGDFNTLARRAPRIVREFLEARGYTTPLSTGTGTWRSGPLRLHADWIFGRGLRFLRCGVARGVSVSDHWPVWAEIEPE